jgi:hypothetical protein
MFDDAPAHKASWIKGRCSPNCPIQALHSDFFPGEQEGTSQSTWMASIEILFEAKILTHDVIIKMILIFHTHHTSRWWRRESTPYGLRNGRENVRRATLQALPKRRHEGSYKSCVDAWMFHSYLSCSIVMLWNTPLHTPGQSKLFLPARQQANQHGEGHPRALPHCGWQLGSLAGAAKNNPSDNTLVIWKQGLVELPTQVSMSGLSAAAIVIFRTRRQHAHHVLARDGSIMARAISATRDAFALFVSKETPAPAPTADHCDKAQLDGGGPAV